MLDGELGVLGAVEALDEQLHAGELAELVEGGPGGVRRIVEARQAVIHRPVDRIAAEALVAGQAVAGVGAGEACAQGGVAAGQQVDGPDQGRATRILDALHQPLGLLPLQRHVELLPGRGAEGLGDLLHRIGGDVREDHGVAS